MTISNKRQRSEGGIDGVELCLILVFIVAVAVICLFY